MSGREHDIKAPDGYLLGGLRSVRRDGTILFHRMFWTAPKEWAGARVWVHVTDGMALNTIDAARPGLHIYEARAMTSTCTVGQKSDPTACIELLPQDRPDAKPGYRSAHMKAWVNRTTTQQEPV